MLDPWAGCLGTQSTELGSGTEAGRWEVGQHLQLSKLALEEGEGVVGGKGARLQDEVPAEPHSRAVREASPSLFPR